LFWALSVQQSSASAFASEIHTVSWVIDGDTIELSTGEKVRYIGIDTPEVNRPLGREITKCNDSLVGGREVHLVFGKDKYDRYGRLLAYVYINGEFINIPN
jgi:micrococcal nuclease